MNRQQTPTKHLDPSNTSNLHARLVVENDVNCAAKIYAGWERPHL
jgi:hypothetical protein